MQAFLYGPLVLAGDLGSEGLDENRIIGAQGPRLAVPGAGQTPPRADAPPPLPALEVPALKAANADPASWIQPSDGPMTFQTTGQRKDVTLRPLNSIIGKRYAVNWQVGEALGRLPGQWHEPPGTPNPRRAHSERTLTACARVGPMLSCRQQGFRRHFRSPPRSRWAFGTNRSPMAAAWRASVAQSRKLRCSPAAVRSIKQGLCARGAQPRCQGFCRLLKARSPRRAAFPGAGKGIE